MKSYSFIDFPKDPDAVTVKYSFYTTLFGTMCILVVAGLGFYIGISGGFYKGDVSVPAALGYWTGAIMALFSLIGFGDMRCRLLSSNWLLKITPVRILIKYRSYQNHSYPKTDIQVIELGTNEIDWFRKISLTRISEGHDSTNYSYIKCIEFKLSRLDDLNEIDRLIKDEIARPPAGNSFIKSKIQHYPVYVSGNVLRVDYTCLLPNVSKVVKLLSQYLSCQPELKIKEDLRSQTNDTEKQTMNKAKLLWQNGQKIEAIRMVKAYLRISLSDARRILEES